MMKHVHAISDIVRKDPDVTSVSASVGAGTVNATLNTARLFIVLKPHNQRAGAEEIIDRLRNKTRCASGHFAFHAGVAGPPDRYAVSRTQYQYILQDADAGRARGVGAQTGAKTWTTSASDRCRERSASHGLQVNDQRRPRGSITAERRDGLNMAATTRSTTPSDNGRSRLFTRNTNQFTRQVARSRSRAFRTSTPGCSEQESTSNRPRGFSRSPLSALATMTDLEKRLLLSIHSSGAISRASRSPSICRREVRSSDAIPAIEKAEREIGLAGQHRDHVQRSGRGIRSSLTSEPFLILAAIVVIYIVLGVLYESYIHPITILVDAALARASAR